MTERTKRTVEPILSFALHVAPDGEVYECDEREARIARRVCGAKDEYEEILLDPGGMIVMSTDVNATAGRGFIGWAKGITKTFFNRLLRTKKVDKEMMRELKRRGLDMGWSVGNLFKGRYHNPKTGENFDERSFAVDVRGAPMGLVEDVAKALMKKFDQHSVLVVDYSNNRPKLIVKK